MGRWRRGAPRGGRAKLREKKKMERRGESEIRHVLRWECPVDDGAGCSLVEVCRPPLSFLSGDSTHHGVTHSRRLSVPQAWRPPLPRPTMRARVLFFILVYEHRVGQSAPSPETGAIFRKKREKNVGTDAVR